MGKVACVIPSAGWGSVCPERSTPKVLEPVGGRPMICQVIDTVLASRVVDGSIVVVVGSNHYGDQICRTLSSDYPKVQVAYQPERRGAADAVSRAFSCLNGEQSLLVTFGDMPLWRPQTLRQLVLAHSETRQARISLVTVKLEPGHRTEKYGRIVRDEHGKVIAALEPSELVGQDLPGARSVNPSLYVFDRRWFVENLSHIPPVDKGDGFAPELHLPRLLPLASQQGVTVKEIPLADPNEALGVNTLAELIEARVVLESRGVLAMERANA